jgi:hypothetical protein
MLRWVIIGYGLLSLIGAAILSFLVHATFWLAVYLAGNGFILVSAMLLERKRYHTPVDRTQGFPGNLPASGSLIQRPSSSWKYSTIPQRVNASIEKYSTKWICSGISRIIRKG